MKKLAIILPGFLDSKDYPHLVDLDNEFKKLGFSTVRLNPTGTWGDEQNITKYSISQYLEDIDEVINQSGKQDRIVLAGHSLGGTVAILYAASHENISTVIAIMSPATYLRDENWQKIVKWQKDGFKISVRDLPGDKNVMKKFILPYDFIEDSKKYDVIKEILKFTGNMLLIAGEQDDCVTFDQIQEIYDHANQPKSLKLIRNIGHDYRHNKNEIKIVNKEVVDFIKSIS